MKKTPALKLPLATLVGLILGLIAGCDQPPSSPSQPATVTATPATATPAKTYPATLAEGIDFAKPGYPDFIAEVTGLSSYETWGRWSEGDTATFRFKQPLPTKFTLVVTANAFGPNTGKPVKVTAGAAQQEFTLSEPGQTIRLDFALSTPADTLEFTIPQPASPQELGRSNDPRKLGIGFIKLQIVP